jgi:hypothetical protein
MISTRRLAVLVVGAVVIAGAAGAASGPVGSRSNPVPLRKEVRLAEGWVVSVRRTDFDAWPEVRASNSFNDPPRAGRLFVMATVRATYRGKDESSQAGSLTFKAVGRSNVAYATFRDACGVIPVALDDTDDVFRGGTVAGNVCWSVRKSDVGTLLMYVDQLFTRDVFFRLRQ